MKSNWNIQDYEMMQELKIKNWPCIGIIFIFMIGIVILVVKFPFQIYEKEILFQQENRFFLMVDSKKISFLEQQKQVYINHDQYSYDVVAVDTNYTTLNNTLYQIIYINLYSFQTDAATTECYFLKKNQTLLEMILEWMKGEKTT